MNCANGSLMSGYVLKEKYRIGSVLGIGGFGMTYLAENVYNGRKYAIKEYFPGGWAVRGDDGIFVRATEESKEASYAHGLEVFVNEAKILKGLSNDEVVVNVRDFFYANNTGYIVMEYIMGMTLADYMRMRKKPIEPEMAGRIITDIAKSMSKIHSLGLLHRDISPDNIMILKDGRAKLIDFGATRQYVSDRTNDMSVLIKPGFAPIEQYSRSGRQGPWSDVYALAATYYYIVSGKRPLQSIDRCTGEIQTPLCNLKPEIPKAVSDVIDHALELDHKDRIQSMAEFIRSFESAAGLNRGGVMPHVLMKADGRMRKWKFSPERSIKIGRYSGECDIIIQGSEISRLHCEVRYDANDKKFVVTDFSINGTYTKNGLIGKGRSAVLDDGDMFYLVNEKNRFILEMR